MTPLKLSERNKIVTRVKFIEVEHNRLLKLYVCRITDIIDTKSCLQTKIQCTNSVFAVSFSGWFRISVIQIINNVGR